MKISENLQKHFGVRPSVSLFPLPEFDETVRVYFKIFDILDIKNSKINQLTSQILNIPADELLNRNFQSLSAGEKRRVDLLRCALSSNVTVVDEPFSNSSSDYCIKIMEFLNHNFQYAIIITHTQQPEMRNFNIIDLDKGVATPELCRILYGGSHRN